MSTLVSSFVKDRASAAQLPTASLISGAAKVWANVNTVPATAVLNGSLNVSSLADNSMGMVSPFFSTAFASNVYTVSVTCQQAASLLDNINDAVGKNTGYCTCRHQENSVFVDTPTMDVVMIGNLA